MLAACCSLLFISMVTMVQKVQRVKQSRPRAPKLKTRTRIHPPVTVSEYIKSWMRDISNVLWWKPAKTWSSKRFAVKKPTKRVSPQSSGRNFRPHKRQRIQPEARWSKQKRRSTRFECMTAIIAMKAKQTHQDEVVLFDTDAKAIRIDNCASSCISNDKRDFITPLKKVNKKFKGLGGTLSEIYSGTIKWSIEDDDGVPHDLVIPNGLYNKENHLQSCCLHSTGPRLPKTSSLCQEAHGVQHIMIASNSIGTKGDSPRL
jgi:hypothetical protein